MFERGRGTESFTYNFSLISLRCFFKQTAKAIIARFLLLFRYKFFRHQCDEIRQNVKNDQKLKFYKSVNHFEVFGEK